MQKVDLPTSFTKLNENCGLPDIFTDYQIRHLGNPSGLPEILLKIDPCSVFCDSQSRGVHSRMLSFHSFYGLSLLAPGTVACIIVFAKPR